MLWAWETAANKACSCVGFSRVHLSGHFRVYAHICQSVCKRPDEPCVFFSQVLGSSVSQDEFICLFVQPKPNVGRSQAKFRTDRRGHSPCIMLLTVRREVRKNQICESILVL